MRSLAALCALMLGACASFAPPGPAPQLGSVPASFEMSGRISIRQADRSDIAKLRWTHRGDRDAWIIASPLGNEVARIESDRDGAALTQAGGATRRAGSFEALAEETLGVGLDPAMLAAWLHGNLRDTPPNWRVTIDERQDAGAVQLARRITAQRAGVVVRLVVDDYRPLAD